MFESGIWIILYGKSLALGLEQELRNSERTAAAAASAVRGYLFAFCHSHLPPSKGKMIDGDELSAAHLPPFYALLFDAFFLKQME